jgi:hypothetical protein
MPALELAGLGQLEPLGNGLVRLELVTHRILRK